jgi:L-alanine-DL-glutamate epimerase-like enolase superfamily enzyme
MRIQSIETFTQGRNMCIVRVRAEDGTEGYGELPRSNADLAAMVLHRMVAPFVLGMDASDPDALCDFVFESTYKFPGSFVCRALGGLDTALWDIRGKQAGKSVAALLGGAPKPVRAYASSMSRTAQPDEIADSLLKARDAGGFSIFKIKIGKRNGHDEDEWPGRTESVVKAVRKALGDDAELYVDANSCYSPGKAVEVAKLLEDEGVALFEEPCPWWEVDWTAEVRSEVSIPVGGGEQDFWLPTWRRIIGIPAVDVVQPDVGYVGGLTRALRVARMAEDANLSCMPHNPSLCLMKTFTLHLLCAIPNAGRAVEYGINPQAAVPDLYDPQPAVADGLVQCPDGPGWGVTVRPEWLEKAERTVSEAS